CAGAARCGGKCHSRARAPPFLPERPAPATAGRVLARLDHAAIFRLLSHTADGAEGGALARCRCALAQAGRDRSHKAILRLGAAAAAWQLCALSARGRFYCERLRLVASAGGTDSQLAFPGPSLRVFTTPPWRRLKAALRHACRDLRGGRAAGAGAPRRRDRACAAQAVVLCGARRAKTLLWPVRFFQTDCRPRSGRLAHLAKRPRQSG